MNNTKYRVACDLDGVVRDWLSELIRIWYSLTGEWVKEEERTKFALSDGFKHHTFNPYQVAFHSHAKQICLQAPPVPGALGGLDRLHAEGIEVYILTAHEHGPSRPATLEWCAKYELPVAGVIFTEEAIKKAYTPLAVDLFIDDGPHQALAFEQEAKQHILYNAPYNRELPETSLRKRAYSWEDVVSMVLIHRGMKDGKG